MEMIPLAIPDLRGRESEYLAKCVADNWVSSAGPYVTEFEEQIASVTGRKHAVAMVNGTTALQLALEVAGVARGDAVIVPDWTFAATANAVIHAGAIPVFVDVTWESWTLDPALAAAAIARFSDRKIAAIVAVHSLGHPADIDSLNDVATSHGIPLIEDAAGAIGTLYKGRPAAGLADLATLSFNGNKLVTAGGGGMVLTDDAQQATRARHLSSQARVGARYQHDAVGYNYRMTNVNAAIGLAQVERLEEMIAIKRAIASRYDTALAGRDDISPMPRCAWATINGWLYSVLCGSVTDADSLIRHMQDSRIQARSFWESLSAQPPYATYPKHLSGVSETLSGRVVSLPCSSNLSADQQSRVLDALSSWRGVQAVKAA